MRRDSQNKTSWILFTAFFLLNRFKLTLAIEVQNEFLVFANVFVSSPWWWRMIFFKKWNVMRFGLPSLFPASKNLSILYYKYDQKAYLWVSLCSSGKNIFWVFFIQHLVIIIGPDSQGMLSGSSLEGVFIKTEVPYLPLERPRFLRN